MSNDIKEKTIKKGEKLKKEAKKAVAVGLSTAVLAVGAIAAIEAEPVEKNLTPEIMNPDPVVLEIEEVDAINNETEDNEEETKKRGVLGWLKMALYSFFAGIAGFVATKIPWKKVFTKRNIILFLVLLALLFTVRHILPLFMDLPWGNDYFWLKDK